MPATESAYSTTPLKPGNPEIRLLELLPGPETSPISGKLSRRTLDDGKHANPPYDALSYMWGTPNGAKTIQLNQDDNFKVTSNLAAALHALRLRDQPRVIWIDAICINQNNVQERSDQVQLMRKIYQNAATVYVWLDIEIDLNNPALRKLLTFDDHSIDDDLGTDASFWEPLKPIFKNPYWMRVWIQQEVSNAANLVI
ncbi:HET-domain-containing protein, partial [Cadophora sp. DSE1049]